MIKFVSNYAALYGWMKSGLSRNLITRSENSNLSVSFLIHGGLSKVLVFKTANSHISPTYYSRAPAALELIMFKRGVLHVNDFS